jgi:hypothetical protein
LFRPVFAGLWTHADIAKDTFSFVDLIDAHEFLDVQTENKARAEDAAQNAMAKNNAANAAIKAATAKRRPRR